MNIEESAPPKSSSPVPVSTLMVLTTASFAERPASREVLMRQSLKPSGENIGEINFPTAASRLCEESVT